MLIRSCVAWCVLCLMPVCVSGCLERELAPQNPCLVTSVDKRVDSNGIDKLDIVFMVDNSHSMAEEQAKLRAEFPELIKTLTTGTRAGKPSFAPVSDMHLAVVSSDLGTRGAEAGGCSMLGDDGALQHASNPSGDATLVGCKPVYPSFLEFRSATDDPLATANDFACIATLGSRGCGYEMQLESTLKALSPHAGMQMLPPSAMMLVAGGGSAGVSQSPPSQGAFLRSDPSDPALLAIVLVTDEDDCSAKTTDLFESRFDSTPNLRCHSYQDRLHDVQRYIEGFKQARPSHPELVLFAAIAGVPPALVNDAVDSSDAAARDAYYDGMLAHPDMQPRVNAAGDHLLTSCTSANGGDAYPPRRIVEVARGFGALGVVQSICQPTFAPAMDAIIELISSHLTGVCLPNPLVRDKDGLVDCNVVWELPPSTQQGTLHDCSQREFLSVPTDGRNLQTKAGANICVVRQLPVAHEVVANAATGGDGWYYDTFSKQVLDSCKEHPQRVAFTQAATPPIGVSVHLQCFDAPQRYVSNRVDVDQTRPHAEIGDACEEIEDGSGAAVAPDAACWVQLLDTHAGVLGDGLDRSMFCHPALNVCMKSCTSHDDCPPAWVCDDRPQTLIESASTVRDPADVSRVAGSAMCVNPTCLTGKKDDAQSVSE